MHDEGYLKRSSPLSPATRRPSAIAACGGDDDDDGGGGGGKASGGSIKIGTVLPDTYDPRCSRRSRPTRPCSSSTRPLTTYKPTEGTEGAEVIPGLAEALPEVTNGGKTYKFKLRDGPQVLRRHARQGQRLRAHDQAPGRPRRPVLARSSPGSWAPRSSRRPKNSRRTSRASRPTTRRARSRSPSRQPDSKFLVRARPSLRRSDAGGQVAVQEP